jgi:hypothetical protein
MQWAGPHDIIASVQAGDLDELGRPSRHSGSSSMILLAGQPLFVGARVKARLSPADRPVNRRPGIALAALNA